MSKKYRVCSLFSGIGGIDLGFKQAGFEIVWANEIDKAACETYKANFGDEHLVNCDIRKVDTKDIPDFDILVAGFPCQPFSVAGKQEGFSDPRGKLFFQIERIVSDKKPKVIFLENVKNIIDHDNGRTFNKIFASLAQFGYCVRYEIMNLLDYANIPQNRERVYIIAFLDEYKGNYFIFPQKKELTQSIFDIINIHEKKHQYYYLDNDVNFSNLKSSIKDNHRTYQIFDNKIRASKPNLCPTLTASMSRNRYYIPIIKDDYSIRNLTPSECLLMQGFPSSFKFSNKISINDAYKQVWNSVCVPIIHALAENIKIILK